MSYWIWQVWVNHFNSFSVSLYDTCHWQNGWNGLVTQHVMNACHRRQSWQGTSLYFKEGRCFNNSTVMYMYSCIHTCMYPCMHFCIYMHSCTYMHCCMYVYICIPVDTYIHTCIYTGMHVHTGIDVLMYSCMYLAI